MNKLVASQPEQVQKGERIIEGFHRTYGFGFAFTYLVRNG
jgi:hypothetical protein